MEIITINGKRWQKYVGNEGQDVYVAQFLENGEDFLGKNVDEDSYDILIEKDTDFYLKPNCDPTQFSGCSRECFNCTTEENVAFKFRKNVFTKGEQNGAFEGLYGAARESHNRGMAAGERNTQQGKRDWVTEYQQKILEYYENEQPKAIDGTDILKEIEEKYLKIDETVRGLVWLRSQVEKEFGTYDNFFPMLISKLEKMKISEAKEYSKKIQNNYISKTNYATALWSGIAGFYGRYPRIPYGRATSYVEQNREIFERCYPFARKLEKKFKELLPARHKEQQKYAEKIDPKFLIGEDTTFTTITVNTTTKERNARMACHRDAGSLNAGFSNLTVISDGNSDWDGGYLVCPEVRTAINVRPGDLLLIDNMRIIHGNTEIKEPNTGDMLRMSLVFYFREDMEKLGSWDYEYARKSFVDDRRKNKNHPYWKNNWNGVSPGMWGEREWYDYLESNMGKEIVSMYHPEAYKKEMTLEGFFS